MKTINLGCRKNYFYLIFQNNVYRSKENNIDTLHWYCSEAALQTDIKAHGDFYIKAMSETPEN